MAIKSTKSTRDLQRALNKFTSKYLEDITPLRVDGEKGASTRARIRLVKYYLGYVKARRTGAEGVKAGAELRHRMWNPKSLRYADAASIARGVKRRTHQRYLAKKSREQASNWRTKKGFGTFDGKTVGAWMIPWLEKSRAHGWKGTVVSGVRTAAYSEHLCYAMCGAPRCPGRCAGRSSNHNMETYQGYPAGALDVTYYQDFGRIQRVIGSPLKNSLGAQDPVHFSVSGG